MKLTILGCGGSNGVPLIGGVWGNCNPNNPRNRRLRSSVLVEEGETRLLVDSSPDLRQQLLAAGTGQIDALIYTHAHADHLHGIDDLRMVNVLRNAALDIYGDASTVAQIRMRFGYAFTPLNANSHGYFYKPCLVPHEIAGPFRVGTIDVFPFAQDHGYSKTLGLRFGPIAYSTDVVDLGAAAFEALAGVKVWVVDCLRFAPHETHSHFDKTIGWIARVNPDRAILTHMNHAMDYDSVSVCCPPGVEPAYDGLVVEV